MKNLDNQIEIKTELIKFNITDGRFYFNDIDITASVIRYDFHGGDINPKAHHLKIELMVQV